MKIKSSSHFLALLACSMLLLFTGSCTHYFYAPTPMHTALLKKKNEATVAAAVGQSGEINFYSLNAAYALTHKLGVYGTYFHTSDGNNLLSAGNGTYMDLAIGKFDSVNRHLRYELMLGAGNAHVLNNYGYQSDRLKFIENNFLKTYAQGNIGYRSKYFDACLAMRVGYVHQYNIYPSDTLMMTSNQNGNWMGLTENVNQIAIEPGIYLSGGLQNWKLQLGFCRSSLIPIQTKTTYNYQKAIISLGLKVNFTATK